MNFDENLLLLSDVYLVLFEYCLKYVLIMIL